MQKYSGIVEDCCCDYETVDHLNVEVLHPSLQELVKTPFFRYFKVCLSIPYVELLIICLLSTITKLILMAFDSYTSVDIDLIV